MSRIEERTLYRHRARLFTMSRNGQWSELGTGDAKILLHMATNRTRLVMRKDKTNTIILNQLVQPDAILIPAKSENEGGGRAFVFEAEDYATGEMKKATFAIRFKGDVLAGDFQKVYTESKERNRAVFALEAAATRTTSERGQLTTPTASSSSSSTPASSSSSKSSSAADSVVAPSTTATADDPASVIITQNDSVQSAAIAQTMSPSSSSSSSSSYLLTSASSPLPASFHPNARNSMTIQEEAEEEEEEEEATSVSNGGSSSLTDNPVSSSNHGAQTTSIEEDIQQLSAVQMASPAKTYPVSSPRPTTETRVTFAATETSIGKVSAAPITSTPTTTTTTLNTASSNSSSSSSTDGKKGGNTFVFVILGVAAIGAAAYWADQQGHLKDIKAQGKTIAESALKSLKEIMANLKK